MLTNPVKTRQRITVPIDTSSHSFHKIQSNKMAGTVLMQVRKGNLRISWSYDSARHQPATTNCIGVDTGISDCFHTSDGRAIGSIFCRGQALFLSSYSVGISCLFFSNRYSCNSKRNFSITVSFFPVPSRYQRKCHT